MPYPGPSPPVRGKQRATGQSLRSLGSIPARAGEAAAATDSNTANAVHPRPCGGSFGDSSIVVSVPGPSPPVRGKPFKRKNPTRYDRSIPARAGEAPAGCPLRGSLAVHPRPCGGSWWTLYCVCAPKGPSPPVRGKLPWGCGHVSDNGSIPARAGEALSNVIPACAVTVHPRPCGGSVQAVRLVAVYLGPSPPVRGKLERIGFGWGTSGSIPARAGEALGHEPVLQVVRVHPRPCGGSCGMSGFRNRHHGPSPPVRGKRSSIMCGG